MGGRKPGAGQPYKWKKQWISNKGNAMILTSLHTTAAVQVFSRTKVWLATRMEAWMSTPISEVSAESSC